MGESMDIVRFFDDNPAYGPTGIIRPPSGRKDISAWQKSVKPTLALLHRPRYMLAGLPEFSQRDSRDYFISGHQLPPYEKAVRAGSARVCSARQARSAHVDAALSPVCRLERVEI